MRDEDHQTVVPVVQVVACCYCQYTYRDLGYTCMALEEERGRGRGRQRRTKGNRESSREGQWRGQFRRQRQKIEDRNREG